MWSASAVITDAMVISLGIATKRTRVRRISTSRGRFATSARRRSARRLGEAGDRRRMAYRGCCRQMLLCCMLGGPVVSSTQPILGVLLPFSPRSNEAGDASCMNAIEYTRKLRRTATISWSASLFLVLGLSGLRVLPFNEFLPFLALLLGMIPIGIFGYRNQAVCEAAAAK